VVHNPPCELIDGYPPGEERSCQGRKGGKARARAQPASGRRPRKHTGQHHARQRDDAWQRDDAGQHGSRCPGFPSSQHVLWLNVNVCIA